MPDPKSKNSIQTIFTSGRNMLCSYCGAYTPSLGPVTICHVCENIIDARGNGLASAQNAQYEDIKSFNDLLDSNRYNEAIELNKKISASKEVPQYTYVLGLAYIKYSNYENSLISHELEGFMETNSVHRENAGKYYSNARMLFSKAIFQANKLAGFNAHNTLDTDYLMLLANLRMDNLPEAKIALQRIGSYSNRYIYAYSNMIFNIAAGDYKLALNLSDSMLRSSDYPINALYYKAFALMKLKKKKQALEIADKLKNTLKYANLDVFYAKE